MGWSGAHGGDRQPAQLRPERAERDPAAAHGQLPAGDLGRRERAGARPLADRLEAAAHAGSGGAASADGARGAGEGEAEVDSAGTGNALSEALSASGHEVDKIEVSGPASHLAARIEAFQPDLIFNTAEGRRGRAREAFYPALFEELNYPYTGSDAYVLTVTLDKWLTKLTLSSLGIDTPKSRLVTARDLPLLDKL